MGKYSSGLSDLYKDQQPADDGETNKSLAPHEEVVRKEPQGNANLGYKGLPAMNYGTSVVNEEPASSNGPGIGEVLGGAALGYAAHKVNQATMVPNDVRNNAINVRQTNQALDKALEAHAPNAQELAEAEAGHKFWHSDEALHQNIDPADLPEPPPKEPVKLNISHEGGPGVENYEGKFVPSEFDKTSPSMSHTQKVVIPANESASMRTQEIAPGTVIEKDSGLALDPKAQQAQIERKTAAIDEAEAKRIADEEKLANARGKAEIKIQPQRDAATKRLELAQARANQTQQELARLTNKSAQQTASLNNKTTDISPAQASKAEQIATKGSKFGDILETGGRIFRKVAGPLNAAAIPYEFNQAVDAYQNGDTTGAIKHGISAAGGLAQFAPAAAATIGLAPEIAAGTAVAGGLAGAGVLAHDVYENWPEIKKWGASHLPDSFK